MHGARNTASLPAATGSAISHVCFGADGIGLAVGSEPVSGKDRRDSIARFWLTRDGGLTWQSIQPNIGFWGRLRAGASWPPEEVESVTVLTDGRVAFAWEDPWLHEGPHCHIVLSADEGARWRYARLPDGCNWLASGPGPLRIFGAGRMASRSDSKSFRSGTYGLLWNLPPGYWENDLPPRFPQFTSEAEGFALAASWPRDDPPRRPEELPPPLVGLLRSQDGGRVWKAVSTWEGPRSTDLNRRHELVLNVRSAAADPGVGRHST